MGRRLVRNGSFVPVATRGGHLGSHARPTPYPPTWSLDLGQHRPDTHDAPTTLWAPTPLPLRFFFLLRTSPSYSTHVQCSRKVAAA